MDFFMKIRFMKSKSYPDCYMYSTSSSDVPIETITLILKDKFGSVTFYNNKNYFNFREAADEAAFLLWSNNGIEV